MTGLDAYELVDFGAGERLERFGDRLVIRPHPGAVGDRQRPVEWRQASLRFDRNGGWTGPGIDTSGWTAELAGVRLELRLTRSGQVGLFPEQLGMGPWVIEAIAASSQQPSILNLFAYTGLTTLAAAAAGAAVTHVDASRPTVSWARRNADLSGLTHAPVRWIVDDAMEFVAREGRRGRQFEGVVLDPPTYGHGPGGRDWRLPRDLGELIAAIREVLAPTAFVLVTCHTPDVSQEDLAGYLADVLGRARPVVDRGELAIETRDGRRLVLGTFARFIGGA